MIEIMNEFFNPSLRFLKRNTSLFQLRQSDCRIGHLSTCKRDKVRMCNRYCTHIIFQFRGKGNAFFFFFFSFWSKSDGKGGKYLRMCNFCSIFGRRLPDIHRSVFVVLSALPQAGPAESTFAGCGAYTGIFW